MHTPRTMITFKEHGTRFTYRVGGIVIHNDQVLLLYPTFFSNALHSLPTQTTHRVHTDENVPWA